MPIPEKDEPRTTRARVGRLVQELLDIGGEIAMYGGIDPHDAESSKRHNDARIIAIRDRLTLRPKGADTDDT